MTLTLFQGHHFTEKVILGLAFIKVWAVLKLLRVVACLDKIVCCTQDVFSHFGLAFDTSLQPASYSESFETQHANNRHWDLHVHICFDDWHICRVTWVRKYRKWFFFLLVLNVIWWCSSCFFYFLLWIFPLCPTTFQNSPSLRKNTFSGGLCGLFMTSKLGLITPSSKCMFFVVIFSHSLCYAGLKQKSNIWLVHSVTLWEFVLVI